MTTPFKIIVKKLPTALKLEDFLKTIESFTQDIIYHYFVPGKLKFYIFSHNFFISFFYF